ncbi:hypothetical protein DPMN_033650 [Dreissena polymorpha]|uniref:Uncharacterized protein n=1 Tax=Dreissena polymorpha TaxID=45954 RepID=A0A9D4M7E5_DREPO|nr:hypothetical protein DPMN_033650 [Dreissena polymorpha]
MLFFAFPSHQRPGLWRSARPHGVLNPSLATLPRSYCVLTATKADHTASERRPWHSYCVLIATIVVLRTQYSYKGRTNVAIKSPYGRLAVNDHCVWVLAATTRRPWRPDSDPTTSLLRLLRLYGVPTTSFTERRKTPDFGDYFEHVQSSRRGLAS